MATPPIVGEAHVGGEPLVRWRGGVLVGMRVYQALTRAEQILGRRIELTDGYRSAAQQADLFKRKPKLAVPAGRSYHERGLAIDVNLKGWSAAEVNKLGQTMTEMGFTWGRNFKGKREDWHFGLGEGKASTVQTGNPILPEIAVGPEPVQSVGDADALVADVFRVLLHRTPTPEELERFRPFAAQEEGLFSEVNKQPEARQANVGIGVAQTLTKLADQAVRPGGREDDDGV